MTPEETAVVEVIRERHNHEDSRSLTIGGSFLRAHQDRAFLLSLVARLQPASGGGA